MVGAQATEPKIAQREALAGLVERLTLHNEDNGFCVLQVKARGHRDLVTVVGHAAMISPGEFVQANGVWVNDRQHGPQFKAQYLKAAPPTTAEGIKKYLASGMIKGIGPVYGGKLVQPFGEDIFDVIERTPDRLLEVSGIGPKRATRIVAGWGDQKAIREIMIFLHAHGVSTSRAVRIYKTYGVDAIQVISDNLYRLARDIRGIGFKSADAIAAKLGIEKTAPIRTRAGILFALTEAMDDGHCGLPEDELLPAAAKRLTEITGLEAKTIHRLLDTDPNTGGFKRGQDNPVDGDLLVIDETSIVDVPLMNALLIAVADETALILVGDVDQLPSVGPGQVLADIIASGAVPVVRLTEVFRQAAASRIITNAHRINQGQRCRTSSTGPNTARTSLLINPFDRGRRRNTEKLCRRPPRHPALNSRYQSFAQIHRKRFCHKGWHPPSAHIFNQRSGSEG